MIEVTTAMAVLLMAMIFVAQMGVWNLRQRSRDSVHYLALEIADNVLESAQALPYERLDAAWAQRQKIPDGLAQRLKNASMKVQVDETPAVPHLKHVRVEIDYGVKGGIPEVPIRLEAFIGPLSSSTKGKGVKP